MSHGLSFHIQFGNMEKITQKTSLKHSTYSFIYRLISLLFWTWIQYQHAREPDQVCSLQKRTAVDGSAQLSGLVWRWCFMLTQIFLFISFLFCLHLVNSIRWISTQTDEGETHHIGVSAKCKHNIMVGKRGEKRVNITCEYPNTRTCVVLIIEKPFTTASNAW